MKKSELGAYLQSKGSPMARYADAIYSAANRYRIDPRLIVAISGAESSFGKHLSGTYNAWGIGPGRSYGSWPEGIEAAAKLLREGYVGQGLTSLSAIQQKWAPIAAANDPRNMNSAWLRNTSAFYRELGGKALDTTSGWRKGASPKVNPTVTTSTSAEIPQINPKNLLGTFTDLALGHDPGFELGELNAIPQITSAPAAEIPVTAEQPVESRSRTMRGSSSGLTPEIQSLADQYGLTITSGFRSIAKQAQLYAGRSGAGTVGKPGSSYHNYGRAIDVAPNAAGYALLRYAVKHPGQFREVFFDGGPGYGSVYIKDGVLYPGKRLGGHADHVHVAV